MIMKTILSFFICTVISLTMLHAQTVTDFDGNVYDTVVIGSQVWLKQNLKVTHFRNGDLIPNVTDVAAWPGMTSGARCYYDNDSATYDSVYGALYNWHAVNNSNGLCPQGWHVPSDAEWTTVESFLGGSAIAGGKMKEAGTLHWKAPNVGATNVSGFTGLPGGMRGMGSLYETLTENGLWWTSTPQNNMYVWSRYFWYLFAGVDRNPTPKTLGLSVRCIADVNVGEEKHTKSEVINLYPNPCKGRFKIEFLFCPPVNLFIFNLTGDIVMQKQLPQSDQIIDAGNIAKGLYLVEIRAGSTIVREKLVIE